MKILSFSGMIPEQICDTVRFCSYNGDKNIEHYCPYASDFVSQVLQDESVDGAVFPRTCDSSRNFMSYLSESGKFLYQLIMPVTDSPDAVSFLAAELKDFKSAVEKYYSVCLRDIPERIVRINDRNAAIQSAYEDLEQISYAEYIQAVHKSLSEPYIFRKPQNKHLNGKRLFLVGSFLEKEEISSRIEEAGFNIVGDYLPESGRLYPAHVDTSSEDVYTAIAESMLRQKKSPSLDNFQSVLNDVLAEYKRCKAEAILFITQKFCEPYDYFYYYAKQLLEERKIPYHRISLTDSLDMKSLSLSLEAFSATL